jgi:hypothetical protein
MKYIALVLTLFFTTSAHADQLPMLVDLSSLQWKNRIIVVNETQNEAKVMALFEKHTAEINDRDIIWFILREDRTLTNYPGELPKDYSSSIRESYGVGQGKVILIGKDGGIKSRSDRVDLKTIFSDIDAMPMRQYEMQN